jgi:hypothetical protein
MCTSYDSPLGGSFKDQTKTLIYYPSFFSMVIHIKTIYDVFHYGYVIYLEIIERTRMRKIVQFLALNIDSNVNYILPPINI